MPPAHWLALVSDRALLLFMAVIVSLLLGGPRRLHHALGFDRPATMVRRIVLWMGRKLDRSRRAASTLRSRGLLMTVFCLAVASVCGAWLEHRAWASHPGGPVPASLWLALNIVALASLLPMRPVAERSSSIRRALEAGTWKDGLAELGPDDWEGPQPSDTYGLVRLAVEQLAGNVCRRLLPTAFWYLLFGLPAAFATAALGLLARLYGEDSPSAPGFGQAAFLIDAAWLAIPLRLACAVVLSASIVVPGASPWRGGRAMMTLKYASPSQLSAACFAGTLGIALGGPRLIGGVFYHRPWVGQGSAMAEPADLRRAQYLHAVSVGIFLLLVCLANLHPHRGYGMRLEHWWHHAVSSNLHAAL